MNISLLKAPIGGIIGLEMITFVEPLGLEKVRAFGPDIVGLQCNFTTERYRSLRLGG